jgi:CspA family cold shock protein
LTLDGGGKFFYALQSEYAVSKNWERRPQRRGFDEDDYPQPFTGFEPRSVDTRFQAASGPPTTGIVKWYSAEKGFGFVGLADGSGDAFLHVSVLERSGNQTVLVLPGSTLELRVARGQKGQQVTEVISVDTSTALQEPIRRPRSEGPAYRSSEQGVIEEFGTVKFYATERGFGFITCDGNGRDVFVHASVLKRSGIVELMPGQRVAILVAEAPKGLEATSVRLA